jgi:hypothetical protein
MSTLHPDAGADTTGTSVPCAGPTRASVARVEPRRTRTRPGIGVLMLSGVLTAGAVTGAIAVGIGSGTGSSARSGIVERSDADGAVSHRDTSRDTAEERAATRSGSSDDGAPYAFWEIDHRGGPLRWDACTPIGFVLNTHGAHGDAERDVRAALSVLADAAGLELVLHGPTDERPSSSRPLVEPDGSGWRWRPVLIAWAEPGEGDLPLTSLDRGIALPVAVHAEDREAYVTGQVIINAARTDLLAGFGDRSTAVGATLIHELAHLLGLDHVDDPTQVMWVDPGSGPVVLGSGDLAGLERLGRASGCNPAPSAESGRGLTHR